MKTCTKCQTEKEFELFSQISKTNPNLRPWCKVCRSREALVKYHSDPESHIERSRAWKKANRAAVNTSDSAWRRTNVGRVSQILSAARKRAKLDGVPFDLTPADIQIPELCPVFGHPLVIKEGKGASPWSASLDKVIPSKGYVPGNVQVISYKANLMKTDATPEELLAFAKWVQQKFGP